MTDIAQRAARRLRATVRSAFGLWVLYEVKNKVLLWPAALRWRWWEHREFVRIRATVTVPPTSVTTVIPTYRRPEGLIAAVTSALAQPVDDHVVLVVDDGGGLPPNLPHDDRLVAFSLSRNTAIVGVVRNVGLCLARSPVVAFLDDDNTWTPEHLPTALTALDQGADGVYTAVERRRPDGTLLDVLSHPFDRRALSDDSFIDTNSIVVRAGPRVRFSRLPRKPTLLPREDWEFMYRFSRRRRVVHLPDITVRYTVNPSSYFTAWGDSTAGDVT